MKKYKKSRINTFFIEMIIVILFFSIASTIVVEVFAKTNYDIKVNKIKSKCITKSNAIGDLYSSNMDVAKTLVRIFGDDCEIFMDGNDNYILNLDDNLLANGESDVVYKICEARKQTKAGYMGELKISCIYNNEVIYESECGAYISN